MASVSRPATACASSTASSSPIPARPIQVSGVGNVEMAGNTIHAAVGDGVRLVNSAFNVELISNIIWTDSGIGINVANNSQAGFWSDYNTLFATGNGQIVYWTKGFKDILDWQDDVARFDLHSDGVTVVNPGWAEPHFAAGCPGLSDHTTGRRGAAVVGPHRRWRRSRRHRSSVTTVLPICSATAISKTVCRVGRSRPAEPPSPPASRPGAARRPSSPDRPRIRSRSRPSILWRRVTPQARSIPDH